jgi:hypothetical protein
VKSTMYHIWGVDYIVMDDLSVMMIEMNAFPNLNHDCARKGGQVNPNEVAFREAGWDRDLMRMVGAATAAAAAAAACPCTQYPHASPGGQGTYRRDSPTVEIAPPPSRLVSVHGSEGRPNLAGPQRTQVGLPQNDCPEDTPSTWVDVTHPTVLEALAETKDT